MHYIYERQTRAGAASPLSRVSYLRVWEEDLMSLERINILGAAGGIKRESQMLRQLGIERS